MTAEQLITVLAAVGSAGPAFMLAAWGTAWVLDRRHAAASEARCTPEALAKKAAKAAAEAVYPGRRVWSADDAPAAGRLDIHESWSPEDRAAAVAAAEAAIGRAAVAARGQLAIEGRHSR